jgi:hypothetical protein
MDLKKQGGGFGLHGKGAFKIILNSAKVLTVRTLTFLQ